MKVEKEILENSPWNVLSHVKKCTLTGLRNRSYKSSVATEHSAELSSKSKL